jgi:hypothetical protein
MPGIRTSRNLILITMKFPGTGQHRYNPDCKTRGIRRVQNRNGNSILPSWYPQQTMSHHGHGPGQVHLTPMVHASRPPLLITRAEHFGTGRKSRP